VDATHFFSACIRDIENIFTVATKQMICREPGAPFPVPLRALHKTVIRPVEIEPTHIRH
jgi:hypothetical protein